MPLLEKGSDERWGHEEPYQLYKKETWVFFLLPTHRTVASASMAASDAAVAYQAPTIGSTPPTGSAVHGAVVVSDQM